jgi:hypothetical protein
LADFPRAVSAYFIGDIAMSLTETEVETLATAKEAGSIEGVWGPNTLSGDGIWEVWILDEGEFKTRFVIEQDDGDPLYFSGFEQLCRHLHRRLESSRKERLDTYVKLATLGVAAFVFIATVSTLLYLVVRSADVPSFLLTAILGVVASGSALFFGQWIGGASAGSTSGPR